MAEVKILCPHCHKPNLRTDVNLIRARFCQHCGKDVVLNNDGTQQYYITRIIKEGGQGAVYEAIDRQQQVYAVKEMIDRFLDPKERTEAIDRFEAEAKMLQGLRHPRIPRIYADFKDEGKHYLVMDFVRGEDLEDILKREGKVPEKQALEWASQIFDVLSYLHNQNPPIIFRDMKPSNVMIERDSQVKMIDFGIAKVFQSSQRGTQIGTPGYAPPEQYQGLATVQSDIYALGATLHHMLTGRDPRDQMPFTFPPVRDLNAAISAQTAAAVDRAVQKFAADRFTTLEEFRNALLPSAAKAVQSAPKASTAASQPAAVATPPKTVTPPPVQQTAPSKKVTQPIQAIPPAVVAATQAQASQAQPSAAARPGAAVQPTPVVSKPRGVGCIRTFFVLLLLVVGAIIALYFTAPNVLAGILENVPINISVPLGSATPTAQTFVQQNFTINAVELIVPAGHDVRQAYTEVYLQTARALFGEGTKINENAPPGFIGQPENLGQDGIGTKYRATMSGFILVPQ